MSEIVVRELPGLGTLRFENLAPGEWLTKKGEPAKTARRRYLFNGEEVDGVSSIVGALDKPALLRWIEDQATRGAVHAERMGELAGLPEWEWKDRVRFLNLGASAKRDEGADRGTAVHEAFHSLATTGDAPNPADYPAIARPWLQGAIRAWMAMDPEPITSEEIVCHPEMLYAGRPDLIARVAGRRTLIDYKTGRGRVFDQAHYQTRGYAEALPFCGDGVDRILIVGIADDGGFELVGCEATPEDWAALLRVYRSRKQINAGMAEQRKAARKLAAA